MQHYPIIYWYKTNSINHIIKYESNNINNIYDTKFNNILIDNNINIKEEIHVINNMMKNIILKHKDQSKVKLNNFENTNNEIKYKSFEYKLSCGYAYPIYPNIKYGDKMYLYIERISDFS